MNILIDSNLYKKEDFGSSFDFMLEHGLIEFKEYLIAYKAAFVGEVITPFNYFISLPKNFTNTSPSNIDLVKSILKEFNNVKKNGRLLIKNKSYEIGNEIESDFFYWRKLYLYFTDYITYEFYYPKKKNIKHSLTRQNGRLNPMLTEVNRDRVGNGATYEIKDYKSDYFRDIFYTTLKSLESKFASDIESKKIKEIEVFLKNKKIEFKIIEFNKVKFFNYTKKLQTNPVHETIFKTLVNYYLHSKIKERNTINVFYTQEFEYLYEYLLKKILFHSNSYRNANWSNPNFKTLHPDIITKTFIGDAKYYKISDTFNFPFEKELYAYNVANDNSQPNFIFIPGEENKHLATLIHGSYKLEVVKVSLKSVLNDYCKNEQDTLNYIRAFIER